MRKIQCIKIEKCGLCSKKGLAQVFYNKEGEARYVRVRHYTGLKEKKPQFSYCRIEDLATLETLLSEGTRSLGHTLGQAINCSNTEISNSIQNNQVLSSNVVVAGGVGFEPTTPNLGGWCSIRTELLAHSPEKDIPRIQTFLLCLERKGKTANTVLEYRKNLLILAKWVDLENPIEVENAIAPHKKKNNRPASNHHKSKLSDCYARY